MALAQPAAAQAPTEAERAIRDQRAAFNRAIATADLPAIADKVQMIGMKPDAESAKTALGRTLTLKNTRILSESRVC